jgi:rhamnose utilization protein RhaD (predicted bifunctional aldolase and dehydrogenase)
MQSLWSGADAERMVERYAAEGVGPTSRCTSTPPRLLGREPKLVLHGGGNTSVKTVMQDG